MSNVVIESATLTVFLDGDAYRRAGVATIVENLIADEAIPPTILLDLNPDRRPDDTSNRPWEYDAPAQGSPGSSKPSSCLCCSNSP